MDVYRTVFQVEVFSDGPYRPGTFASLEEITYDIDEGDCIGDYTQISTEIVPPDQVEAHMLRIGNDGSFFDIDATEDE